MGEEVSAHYTGRRSFLKDGRHNENGFVASNRFFLFSIEFNLNSIFPFFFFFFFRSLSWVRIRHICPPQMSRGGGQRKSLNARNRGNTRNFSNVSNLSDPIQEYRRGGWLKLDTKSGIIVDNEMPRGWRKRLDGARHATPRKQSATILVISWVNAALVEMFQCGRHNGSPGVWYYRKGTR